MATATGHCWTTGQRVHASILDTPQTQGSHDTWQTDVRLSPSLPPEKSPFPRCSFLNAVNNARALRVTELMRDYQDIQSKIAAYSATPSEAAYSELGFVTLRQCHAEARALLNAPYPVELLHPPTTAGEAEKRQLQRFIP